MEQWKKVYGILAVSADSNSEQEVPILMADVAIGIYAVDTAFHRALKIIESGRDSEIAVAIFRSYLNDEIANDRLGNARRSTGLSKFSEYKVCDCESLSRKKRVPRSGK
jgi:hypothetical protein